MAEVERELRSLETCMALMQVLRNFLCLIPSTTLVETHRSKVLLRWLIQWAQVLIDSSMQVDSAEFGRLGPMEYTEQ